MHADPDQAVRAAAFAELERLVHVHGTVLPWELIERGFPFGGSRIRFASRPVGIFKPQQMSAAISIKTVAPRKGRKAWYSDQIGKPDYRTGLLAYALANGGKRNTTNRALDEARLRQAPLIYLVGVAPAAYEPIWPVWVEHLDYSAGHVLLAAADALEPTMSSVAAAQSGVSNELRERSYSLVAAKKRNHQAWFSSRTKAAYGYRCAFSGLPLRRLLVGAHILPDAEEGPPTVTNGICMSTLHHTAFDAHLIGVDPDCRIHVARSVRNRRDGPLLDGLKGLDGVRLGLPDRPEDQPDPEFLDWRFERFRDAAG